MSGNIPLAAFCQSCGSVADAFGVAVQPVTGTLRESRLELPLFGRACQLVATVGPGDVTDVSGDATCTYDGARTTGTWSMSRAE